MWEFAANQLRSAAGPVLVVLLALSIAGLAVGIVKAMEFRAAGVGRARRDGSGGNGPLIEGSLRSKVQAAAIEALGSGRGGAEARERAAALAEEAAIDGLAGLSRHLAFLDAIVQAAPMLGLLGTVFGMIEVFFTMSGTQGAIDPALLSGGIFAALITTAAGLVVAIPFFFAAGFFDAALAAETRAIEGLILRTVHGAPLRRSEVTPRIRASDGTPDGATAGLLDQALARPR